MLAESETRFEVLDMDPDFESRCEEARASENARCFHQAAVHWRAAADKAVSREDKSECQSRAEDCLKQSVFRNKVYVS